MHWDKIETALGECFHDITGLPIYWGDNKPKMTGFKNACGRATLRMLTPQARGVDDIRYTDHTGDPSPPNAGEELTRHICGQREFTLSATVDTFDHREAKAAWYYLERFRTLLYAEGPRHKLRQLGVAFVRTNPIVSLNKPMGQRIVSSAALDVVFSAAVTLDDCKTTYIESVKVSSDLRGPDNVSLPSARQLTDEVMP